MRTQVQKRRIQRKILLCTEERRDIWMSFQYSREASQPRTRRELLKILKQAVMKKNGTPLEQGTDDKKRYRYQRKGSALEARFGNDSTVGEDGVICTLAETHYLVDGSSRVTKEVMRESIFEFCIGNGFIITHKSMLRPGWEQQVDKKATQSRRNDAIGRPLELLEWLWLTLRFKNTMYGVTFIISV